MDSTIQVALIFAGSTMLGPIFLAAYLGYQRRREATAVMAKLDVIHTLVDGTLTAALRSELDSTVRELAMMQEVVELKRADGHDPSEQTVATIKATQDKVDELRAALVDRIRAVELSEAQELVAADKKKKAA